ncbi:GDCCVxC domain-containing (seleno)protein [Providencia rettgeri]|uniref:GDCCVxC domain-containing (seleno)protein n=1 Tax=Providencia rettgeri TaxID=587 RepID=UPI0025549A2C|nr:GDCCVxC domain-containing (seleno)protein [Providencia rettgeri]
MSKLHIELQSELTCPECHFKQVEEMPTDACQWFYECKHCGALLKPLKGDCCVFCSYGSVICPPIQEAMLTGGQECCCSSKDIC